MEQVSPAGFVDVDASEDVAPCVAYLDAADRLPQIVEWRARASERLGLCPGERLLDAGCGTGSALFELAERLAPGGRAVGVDLSEKLLAVAETRRPQTVELVCADVAALPFEDGAFDAYRAERLYQLLDEPTSALAEARRVLRAGGRIVLVEGDWEGLLVDEPEPAQMRRVISAIVAASPSLTIGRRLRRLLVEAGFVDVQVDGVLMSYSELAVFEAMLLQPLLAQAAALGVLAEAEQKQLLNALRERDDQGAFFAALTGFIASATRP